MIRPIQKIQLKSYRHAGSIPALHCTLRRCIRNIIALAELILRIFGLHNTFGGRIMASADLGVGSPVGSRAKPLVRGLGPLN